MCVKPTIYIIKRIFIMYKKTTQGHKTIFKPRRMVIAGIVYDVKNEEELNKIKETVAAKKLIDEAKAEEEKNQKILIKRTISKGSKDIITKEIVDPNTLLTREEKHDKEQKKNKYMEYTKKPGLVVKSNSKVGGNDTNNTNENGQLTIKTHARKIIKKNNDDIVDDVVVENENIEVENINENINENVKSQATVKSNVRKILTKQTKKNNDDDIIEDDVIDNVDDNKVSNDESVVEGVAQSIFVRQEKPPTKIEHPKKPMLLKSNANKIVMKNPSNDNNNNDQSVDNCFTQKYSVINDQWYEFSVKIKNTNDSKSIKLIIKIFNEQKIPLIHPIKISNDLFLSDKLPNNIVEYKIYLYMPLNTTSIDVYILGYKTYGVSINPIDKTSVEQNIDLWKFRKLYDLEFINYYIKNANFEYSDKFINRYNGDYELFKNPNYFDDFIKTLNINKVSNNINENDKIKILYLVHSSIEYENYSYTIKTHQLLKNFNKNDKYEIICATRYGYPYDRELGYYNNEPQKNTIIDNVAMTKLIDDKTLNFNTLNILEYLKKYIIATINFCVDNNVSIIHATTNYWNGIVAVYVAKYLGIKCIYEIRELWNENIILQRPEVIHSDIVKMMSTQEKNIINNVDLVLHNNNNNDNVDTLYCGYKIHKHNMDTKLKLLDKHDLHGKIILGYIGTLVSHEGIEYILKSLKLMNNNNIVLIIIGDGAYKNPMVNFIKTNNLNENVLFLETMKYNEAMEYYNIFDVCVYPKIKCELHETKTSYKLIEAMSFGKSIVTTNVKSNMSIITDNVNGLLCEPDNISDLTDKIKILINDESLRDELGKNAKKWVKKNRDWSKICNKLSLYYDNVLNNDDDDNVKYSENGSNYCEN